MENEEESPFRIISTVRALNSALRDKLRDDTETTRSCGGDRVPNEPAKLWFKESSAKNLRNRDFLSPNTVLTALYDDGQVPPAVLNNVLSAHGSGVLPLHGAEVVAEGLRVCVDHPAAFRRVLSRAAEYLRPSGAQREGCVLLNCPALHTRDTHITSHTLTLGQLRTVLIADHLGVLLRRQGYSVLYCPALPEDGDIINFIKALGVDWPTVPVSWSNEGREQKVLEDLRSSPYREMECEKEKTRRNGEETEEEEHRVEREVKINLKEVVQEQGLQGYDPSLGTCTVQRETIAHLAQLDRVAAAADSSVAMTVLHVASCQDEFRQQQTAMLWRASGATATQRLVVCGPVKTPGAQLSAAQYLQLRRSQMKEASEMKYGEQVEGQTWDDIIRVMTSATVRFELLSTVHTSPVTLEVQKEGGVSTKGPRGGVFVMYNCARLHTLFSSYERGVQEGIYPEIPESSELDFSSLKEEGEWLLLFNYLIPYSELLDQSGRTLELEGGGVRVNLKTEQACKFLVSLSKDFSSYYNRVHVLGEPLPHLFNQMFCRLLLLSALRELYHSALDALNLPPIPQL
ncbi:DALR anticodon-binding domain-containing protein 3 isoform X2 [Clupea harengus]|uniref:DALR anticodon-binding domain-containing protein 3 isoform X2 n=1 Tax=Clupea harengus TaxID=7950 RepID=A0A6P3W593_CLUHA|nr:DALR anticodon-binding domain-containing protein 3 isoform X2 [Clupea harengus]